MDQAPRTQLIPAAFRFEQLTVGTWRVTPMSGTIRIGCSGWIYRHWRSLFYPEKLAQRLWFAH